MESAILNREEDCEHVDAPAEWNTCDDVRTAKRRFRQHFARATAIEEWMPRRRKSLPAFDELKTAIEASRDLLAFLDEDDQPVCIEETWKRAVQFLLANARRAWYAHGFRMQIPSILPGPDGSLDLHWKGAAYEMLINVPTNPASPITYYGDDADGNSIKGTIASGEYGGLVLWLKSK
jgi:hypothetical protein